MNAIKKPKLSSCPIEKRSQSVLKSGKKTFSDTAGRETPGKDKCVCVREREALPRCR